MPVRTMVQLGLLAAGVIVWGFGERAGVQWAQYAGIGLFALAAVLRFAKKRSSE